ncbi:MAG: hypothetical protein LBW85_08770 [Deltaproteobacteria bacterium]|jgi:hypothetical protein|nr:hypothetical protein [Deltaproteobacteria bacterium]
MPLYLNHKLFLPLAAALALLLLQAGDCRAQARPGADPDPDQGFTIETLPDDSPPTQKYKAALRLFSAAQAVYQITSECGDSEAWKAYESRNGNTINLVVRQFAHGGVREAQKLEVDRYAAKLRTDAYAVSSCPGLLADVRDQKWDLYKAERFQEDFQLIRVKDQ